MAAPDRHGFLRQELARWVEQGLVTAEQQEKILALYPAPAAPAEKRRVAAFLPVILIGMAVLLIGVGLILFYAANWRKMPPGLKLAQILGLLVMVHGGAFLLLFGRRPFPIAGRGLLVLGMLSFGAAIGLVAQTYHISAHPTHGLLLWLLGVIALSAVMQERIGYYLALTLALVWQVWEFGAYESFNLPFPVVLAVIALLLYRAGDAPGLLVAALEALLWVYLANVRLIEHAANEDAAALAFAFLQVPVGVCLIALDRLRKPEVLRLAGLVVGALGWICLFVPLIALSWPMSVGEARLPFLAAGAGPILLEHLLLSAVAGGLLLRHRAQGEAGSLFLGLALCFGLAAAALPLGSRSTLLVFTHLGLMGFVMGVLFDAHRRADRGVQRVLALVFAIATLFIKAGGFLILGEWKSRYLVAYGLGAVVLAVVILLINRAVQLLLAREENAAPYWTRILDGLCALVVFLLLYALSFKLEAQESIFGADAVVLLLLGLFAALALLLYAFLWRRSAERLSLVLSAVVFAAALLMLVVSGPAVPWQAYSFVFNLLLLVVEGLLLFHATRANSIALVNLVILGFALQLGTRYFDIFWDLLSGSLLFIVTGLVFFVGGFLLERNRRRLVSRMREAKP